MSEVLHLPGSECKSECTRARVAMTGFVDGDLAAVESAWLDGHLESCAGCRGILAGFIEIDRGLTAWGQQQEQLYPPPSTAREQLSAKLVSRPASRRPTHGHPAAAAAFAAVLVIAAIVSGGGRPAGNRPANHQETRFISIPYLAPLDPHENATIVRMNIRVATLIAAGYRVAADPDAMVPADVLVGEDGRAHAVRVLSDVEFNGTGD